MSDDEIDALDFGVIGIDADERVVIYNRTEATNAGFSPDRVRGRSLFYEVAPCTNNRLVAGRFRSEVALDQHLDYIFTKQMRPTPVRLRLLASDSARWRYMIIYNFGLPHHDQETA